jgi:Ca2+-binding RTX toxin-like protein
MLSADTCRRVCRTGQSFRRDRPRQSSRCAVEQFEPRVLLAASLALSGFESIVATAPTDLSVTAARNTASTANQDQVEMVIETDPQNPLRVAAITMNLSTGLDLYYSDDGGATWTTTVINQAFDGLPLSGNRYDPTIAFDWGPGAFVYVGYAIAPFAGIGICRLKPEGDWLVRDSAQLVEATGGVDKLDKPMVATGNDSWGNPVVSVAYMHDSSPTTLDIVVEGTLSSAFATGTPFSAPGTPVNDTPAFSGSDNDLFPEPAVGPNGELYVAWHDGTPDASLPQGDPNFGKQRIVIDRDPDGLGGTGGFGNDVTVAYLAKGADGISGLRRPNVPVAPRGSVWTGVSLEVDQRNGRLYLAYTDKVDGQFSEPDRPWTQIELATFTPNGANWGNPWSSVVVDSDPALDSTFFHAAVDVDQRSNAVGVFYYRTADSGHVNVKPWVALSMDGGATFGARTALTTQSFATTSNVGKFGDYTNGIALSDGTLHALWSAPGGTSGMDAFYARASFNSATNGNVLTITGDDGGVATNDFFELRLSPQNPAYLEVFSRGVRQFTGLLATIDSISIDGRQLNDNAFFNFDNGNFLSGITVTYNGNTGTDIVSARADRSMTLTNTALSIATYGAVGISSVESATLTGGPSGQNLWATGFSGGVALYGGGGNDNLRGGPGDDSLYGEGGDDVLVGNAGGDSYVFAGSSDLGSDTITEPATNAGTDTINLASFGFASRVNLWQTTPQTVASGFLTLTLSDAAGIENAIGTPLADTLDGNARDNTLTGGNGDDHLFGNDGNDVVNGDAGNDWAYGGNGNDIVRGGVGNDLVFGDAGADFLYHADNPGDVGDGSDILYGRTDGDSIYWDSSQDTIVWQ